MPNAANKRRLSFAMGEVHRHCWDITLDACRELLSEQMPTLALTVLSQPETIMLQPIPAPLLLDMQNCFCAVQTPRIPMPPAFEEGWKLQDEQPVTRKLYDTMVQMLKVINEAVDTLPVLEPMP